MSRILFVISLVFLLVGCDPASKYKEEITEIDSSLAVIDSIEQKYNGIEFDSLQLMVDHVLRNEDSIKTYYSPDTISLYIGIRMNESKGIRKSLKNIASRKKMFGTEISELRRQFKNLKTDIKNGVLKEEEMNKYLKEENAALHKLNVSFSQFYELQKTQKVFYYEAVPVIDSLLIELKNEARKN